MGTTEKPLPSEGTRSLRLCRTRWHCRLFSLLFSACPMPPTRPTGRSSRPCFRRFAKVFGYYLKVGGLMATIFTLGLAIAGIPTGYLLDRTSRKAVIVIGMLIYSVFTLATIYAIGFGTCCSTAPLPASAKACRWQPCLPPWAATSTAEDRSLSAGDSLLRRGRIRRAMAGHQNRHLV